MRLFLLLSFITLPAHYVFFVNNSIGIRMRLRNLPRCVSRVNMTEKLALKSYKLFHNERMKIASDLVNTIKQNGMQ